MAGNREMTGLFLILLSFRFIPSDWKGSLKDDGRLKDSGTDLHQLGFHVARIIAGKCDRLFGILVLLIIKAFIFFALIC